MFFSEKSMLDFSEELVLRLSIQFVHFALYILIAVLRKYDSF